MCSAAIYSETTGRGCGDLHIGGRKGLPMVIRSSSADATGRCCFRILTRLTVITAWLAFVLLLSICRRQAMDARWKWRNAVWTMQRLPRPGRNFRAFFHVLAAPENWSQAMGGTRLGRKTFLHFASCPFPPLLRWSCCAWSRPDQISFELEFRILVDRVAWIWDLY